MATDKQAKTTTQQPDSPVRGSRTEVAKKRDVELTESEQERVQGGMGDGSVRFNRD
jgi:hypothetical protein